MSLKLPTTSATLPATPRAIRAAPPTTVSVIALFMSKNCFVICFAAELVSVLVCFICSLNFSRSTLMGILRLAAGMGISDEQGRQDFAGDQDIGCERFPAHMHVEQSFHLTL